MPLHAHVQALGVLAEDHQVEVVAVVQGIAGVGLAGAKIGAQVERLAQALVKGIASAELPLNSRPVRRAAFSVLKAPDIPSILLEVGFLSSPRDLKNLRDPAFRQSMAAPAMTDEFRDNVVNVFSENYWPAEIDAVQQKVGEIKKTFSEQWKAARKLEGEARKQAESKLKEQERAAIEAALTEDELFTLDVGVSNRGFHYYGSAKFFAQLGEAFAKSLIGIRHQSK